MNKPLKLICEAGFNDLDILIEQENKNAPKNVRIRGPYIVANVKNGNGRTYPEKVVESAVKDYMKNFVEKNRAVGELNHPSTVDIDYNNACHKIVDLKKEDNIWVGESQVLTGTPKGDLLAALLQNGVQVGISTRGVGNIDEKKIVDDYRLITADVVYEPSAPGAFMEGILESKSFMIDEHGEIVEMAFEKLEDSTASLSLKSELKKMQIIQALGDFIKAI
jgi:hypothetical protein